MGIIKAVGGAVSGIWEEQWKEVFSCDAMNDHTLVMRGRKWVSARSTNTRTDDDVITDGSLIIVGEGQAVVVVSQGKVIDVCAEPGEHIFRDPTREKGLSYAWHEIGRRVAFGGDVQPITQRVYFINTRECMGNAFGTEAAIPYGAGDANIGLSVDTTVSCSGAYSYRITDPAKFYRQVTGNIAGTFTRDRIAGRMRAEILNALQPAFASLSAKGLRPSEMGAHAPELAEAVRAEMAGGWCANCGIEPVSVSIASMTVTDASGIRELQFNAALRDPALREAHLAGSAAQAVRSAADGNIAGLAMVSAAAQTVTRGTAGPERWRCACGAENTGKFCTECGKPKPERWTCSCGTENTGKFCTECGKPKPKRWTCSCGTENTGKFCTNCGKRR